MNPIKMMWVLTVIIIGEVLFILHLSDLLNLKEIVAWLVDNVAGQLIVGVILVIISIIFIERKRWERRIKRDDEIEARRIVREEEMRQKERLEQEETKKREKLEQERGKRCEELKSDIKKHNEDMINLIIKYWFHENEKINEERQRTIEHLQKGYPDIWKLECKREDHKKHFLESEKIIRDKIKDKFKKYAPFEWDFDNMEQLLYKAIENFSIKGGTDDDFKIYIHNFQRFGMRQIPDKNDIYLTQIQENFRKLVDDIVDDKTIIEIAKFASNERRFFDETNNKFKQSIEDIKHRFENWGTELKGTCDECISKHGELDSLK